MDLDANPVLTETVNKAFDRCRRNANDANDFKGSRGKHAARRWIR